jgi:hypothetical protein
MIEAALAGENGVLDAGTCADEALTDGGHLQVEPWLVVDRRRVRPLLVQGRVCGGKYVVVMRKSLVRKLEPGVTASAVVVEFEKDTASHYYYRAYLENYDRNGGSGSPGCGAERGGSVSKRHGMWSRNVYDVAAPTQSQVDAKADKK